MASGNGTPRYRVLYTPAVLDRIQQLADRAVVVGQVGEFGAFLLQMDEQLVHDPAGWADSFWNVTGRPGLLVCWRYHRLVCVEFYLSRPDRNVRVTQVIVPPNSPLA